MHRLDLLGDHSEITVIGTLLPRVRGNAKELLDELKLAIALEVARRFLPEEIRLHSRNNLLRWKASGVWSTDYEEWSDIIDRADDGELLTAIRAQDVIQGEIENAQRRAVIANLGRALSVYAPQG